MKRQFNYFILITLLIITGCSDEDPTGPVIPNESINKIMPLGASRVQGARPVHESFRYELWKQLVDGGFTFDFIGTVDDPFQYPEYQGLTFDDDHEGRGGFTSGQILSGISGWLDEAGIPDIVLFSSPGGNDLLSNRSYSDALANINEIIDIVVLPIHHP